MFKFHHAAIETDKASAVLAFYKSVLGFRIENKVHFGGEEVFFLTLGGLRLEIAETHSPAGGSGDIHLCFETDSLVNAIKIMGESGLRLIEGPYFLENGWETVFFEGPAGEVLEFLAASSPGQKEKRGSEVF